MTSYLCIWSGIVGLLCIVVLYPLFYNSWFTYKKENFVQFTRPVVRKFPTVIYGKFQRQNLTKTIWLTSDSPSAKLPNLSDELTVVTAYFNLGSFPKGGYYNIRTPKTYRQWMKVFARIENPLVVYVEKDDDAIFFESIRRNNNRAQQWLTRIVKVNRSELWSFSLQPHIRKIYGRKGYPKHLPNTVRADYSCATHAKYELVQRTIEENLFKTKYICWLDIGLFRGLTSDSSFSSNDPPFRLGIPVGFNISAISYSEVYRRNKDLSLQQIVSNNIVCVSGAFFIARVDVMFEWTLEYMDGVERMMEENWMSTDQQVIYWIVNHLKIKTLIQTYGVGIGDKYNEWFRLGYLAKEAGEKLNQSNTLTRTN